MNSKQKGFSVLHVLLLFIIVGIIGTTGWYVWKVQRDTGKVLDDSAAANPATGVQDKASVQDETAAGPTKALLLATNKVSFDLPESWTFTQGEDQCRLVATAELNCIEGASIIPGEKLQTRYRDGAEHFTIKVSVYENPQKYDAKKWLEEGVQEGLDFGNIKKSSASINGYNTYYAQHQHGSDETAARDLNYSYVIKDKAVVLHARTYELGQLSNGTKVGDFTKFEPQIKEVANSIKLSF